MTGKGSSDRGSQAKRRQSKIWCERCGYGRSACKCADNVVKGFPLESNSKYKRNTKEQSDNG